ncbi:P-loop containing nucleoside triphosphate hydrolase protein [Chytriomyces cf. hyalinus JEL632]|nr:P-loop containing nucleoside triphosphate hydrolase protein [Chytriomyces cf. hyalinus JEL632]
MDPNPEPTTTQPTRTHSSSVRVAVRIRPTSTNDACITDSKTAPSKSATDTCSSFIVPNSNQSIRILCPSNASTLLATGTDVSSSAVVAAATENTIRGMIPRAVHAIFNELGTLRACEPSTTHNETLKSYSVSESKLANTAKKPQTPSAFKTKAKLGEDVSIREDKEGGIAICGATTVIVDSSEAAVRDPSYARQFKRTQNTGDRKTEGICINQGLLVLGRVINCLSESKPNNPDAVVPYGDSKLTKYLQHSLGGNSKTVMLACVSSLESDLSESINTLRYASRARGTQNKSRITIDTCGANSQVAPLLAEIAQLKSLLAEANLAHAADEMAIVSLQSDPDVAVAGSVAEEKMRNLEIENAQLTRKQSEAEPATLESRELIKDLEKTSPLNESNRNRYTRNRQTHSNDAKRRIRVTLPPPEIARLRRRISHLEAEFVELHRILEIQSTELQKIIAEKHALSDLLGS